MREILFKAKQIDNGDWYTAQYLNKAVEIVKGGGVDGN